MPILRLIGIILAFALGGCVTKHPAAVRPFIGQYRGSEGDFVLVQSDGLFLWSPADSDGSKIEHVGLLRPDKKSGTVDLIIVSANPQLGTTVEASADRRVLTVKWWWKARERSVRYERVQ